MIKGVKKIAYISGKIKTNSISSTRIIALANEWVVFGIKEWEAGTTEAEKLKGVTWICQNYNRTKIIGKTKTPNGKNFKFKIPKSLCGVYTYYLEASLSGKTDVRQTGLFVTGNCEAKITKAQWTESPQGSAINSPINHGTTVYIYISTEGLNGFKSLAVEIYKKDGEKPIAILQSENVVDGATVVEVKTTFFQIQKPTEYFYIKVRNPNTGKYVLDGNNNEKHASFLEIKNIFALPQNPFFPTNTTALKVGKLEVNRQDYSKPFSFNITFEIDKKAKTVVPLGILDFENKYENPYFSFKYNLTKGNLDALNFEILDENRKVIYQMGYLKPIIVVAHKKPMVLMEVDKATPVFELQKPIKVFDIASVFKKYEVEDDDYTKVGEYYIHWDGFDNNEVYDSTIFNNKKLTARIKAVKGIESKTIEVDFKTSYDKVQWVDVKIDKKKKRIDTTLRVNLTDGGAEGLDCTTHKESDTTIQGEPNPFKGVSVTMCNWDRISKEALDFYKKDPIKKPLRTYKDLEKITLEGLNQFWSRNSKNIGKGVYINSNLFEVFVNAKVNEKGLSAPSIIYQTNIEEGRSRNWELSRKLFFYEGYLYYPDWKNLKSSHPYFKNKGWYYRSENKTDEKNFLYPPLIEDYKMVSAHEIGHEVLLNYGGNSYSKAHKGTSHWSMIIQKVNDDAPSIPKFGEIDLMKYYQNYYDIPRTIISEFDLLKLIWLTKIKVK